MKKIIYIGGDPGKRGGIGVVYRPGIANAHKWPESERDGLELLRSLSEVPSNYTLMGMVEKVGAMPGQGVTSMFTFGRNYQAMRSAFLAARVPFDDVTPRTWQKAIGISPRKKVGKKFVETKTQFKNRLKAKARQLYPNTDITLATCDAVLIAHYAMLKYGEIK